ncbi:Proteasome maturation factor UMP1 [Macrophomina phaseolina MS6]|uniref:Proteasome maturation factor UMP1 n=1 Tax=Macrophomina phaseolina (strain MS6) TaxID=1126212 RepID=K2SRF5_MACPH|nr:Proteasome maturation factor UMP1 [Macrophomina phaseolina MS6]
MVLDEATNASSAPPDGFADNAYPSDADPYSSSSSSSPSNQPSAAFQIDLNDFPLPPPILGPLVGYPRQRVATNVAEYLKAASHVLRRPLSEDEAKALTYHTARASSTSAWGASAGALAALARCYQTRHSYRFPFWNPSKAEGWNPEVLGPLRGAAARAVYQALRVPPYWTSG